MCKHIHLVGAEEVGHSDVPLVGEQRVDQDGRIVVSGTPEPTAQVYDTAHEDTVMAMCQVCQGSKNISPSLNCSTKSN